MIPIYIWEKGKNEVSSILALAKSKDIDDSARGYLNQIACVKLSAYLELSLKQIINDYFEKRTSKEGRGYIASTTKGLTNLKFEKFKDILARFSDDWLNKFVGEMDNDAKDFLGALIDNRHKIVHERGSNITSSDIEGMVECLHKLLYTIKEIVK